MSLLVDAVKTCFKTCPMCGSNWNSLEEFLKDRHLIFNGYQANFGELDQGIFFFTHEVEECGSTMGLKVRDFTPLFSGPTYGRSRQLSSDCPRYCLDKNNLSRCNAHCENAFAREIAQQIKKRMSYYTASGVHSAGVKTVPGVLELR